MGAVLELRGVVKLDGQGNAVLRRADFAMNEGERICISGLSSYERATLARLIGGLTDPDEGTVTALGRELRSLNDRERAALRNRHIGYASHAPVFWRDMTVLQNIIMPLSLRGVPRTEQREQGLTFLESLGLAYAAFAYPRGLSPFETRIAALARAVISYPTLLILDDVFTGLDEKKTDKLADALNGLDREMSILALSSSAAGALSDATSIKTEYGRIVRTA